MSLSYLLDGYNIIPALPALDLKRLEEAREGLIRLIEIHRPQGSLSNKVTIVFDGQAEFFGQTHAGAVKIVFSRGESADDCIKRMVSDSKQKKNIVVVTNDRDIRFFVRAQGARIVSVEDFVKKLRADFLRKGTNPSSPSGEDSKYISKTLEFQITSELEEIWIKDAKQYLPRRESR